MLYSGYKIIFYYRSVSQRAPVLDYLADLTKKERAKCGAYIHLLALNKGKLLPPYPKHIDKKLWELRIACMGKQHRIFYCLTSHQEILLLSAFQKKSQKTPRNEIEGAHHYYQDYIQRL